MTAQELRNLTWNVRILEVGRWIAAHDWNQKSRSRCPGSNCQIRTYLTWELKFASGMQFRVQKLFKLYWVQFQRLFVPGRGYRDSLLGPVQISPTRNCADIANNLVQRGAQVSAIDVTGNIIFERLYLVSGLGTFGPWVNCPYAPTTLTLHTPTIPRFPCNFSPQMGPQFFCHHDSPSNLAESWYPHRGAQITNNVF